MRLEGKIAIVTGAGTGIGEAISHKFAQEGAKLVLAGLPDDPVEDVAASILSEGGAAVAFLGDLSEPETARACVGLALQSYGRIDILINNAGVFIANADTEAYRIEDFERTIQNNIRTAFLMTKFALPHLQETRGNIIFTGSEAGFNGSPRFTPYGGSKGFLHAFAKGVALEQAPYGVRANCVCPGPIDTAWTRGADSPIPLAAQESIGAGVPLGRRGTPEEIANIFAFLASDEASYVTGALWLADGGVTPAKSDIGRPCPIRSAPNLSASSGCGIAMMGCAANTCTVPPSRATQDRCRRSAGGHSARLVSGSAASQFSRTRQGQRLLSADDCAVIVIGAVRPAMTFQSARGPG